MVYFNGDIDVGVFYQYALSLCNFKNVIIETNQTTVFYGDSFESPSLFICDMEHNEEDGLCYDYMIAIEGDYMNRRSRLINEYLEQKGETHTRRVSKSCSD